MECLWDLFWVQFSVIYICLILKIKYLIALKKFQYVDDILIITNNTNEINILPDTFPKISVLNFTHELNKNNKVPFLDILIDTNYNNLTISTCKKLLITILVLLTLKMNAPSDIK